MHVKKLFLHLTFAIFFSFALTSCKAQTPPAYKVPIKPISEYQQNIETVTNALCGKQIVLLGENGFHGDGKTIAYKSDLVKSLVKKCDFNAVFFESSFYDFQAISMKADNQETITPEMVASSMGWIRNQYQEIFPLILFLYEGILSGELTVGGIDDQPGSRGSFYALEQMIIELTDPLPSDRQERCKTLLKQLIWSSHPKTSPYNYEKRARTKLCLREIRAEFGNMPEHSIKQMEMTSNLDRFMDRDFTSTEVSVYQRDYSMFLNLEWLIQQAPQNSKFIVWTANSHAAKNTSISSVEGKNLGAYVRKKYGDKSYALGFSAAGGTYMWGSTKTKIIPQAPTNSLEAKALSTENGEIAFINARQMVALGKIPSSVFGHKFRESNWHTIFDGIVIFREEQPPKKIAP